MAAVKDLYSKIWDMLTEGESIAGVANRLHIPRETVFQVYRDVLAEEGAPA